MGVLILGGLGHVGSWIARKLVDRGDEVIIYDVGAPRFDALGLDYLEEVRDRLTIEAVDVLDVRTMIEATLKYRQRIDAIVFAVAVIAGPTFKNRPFQNISINTIGLLNALEVSRILGIPRFLNLSSGAVYGAQPAGQTETTPYQVTDLYGATKVANEVFASQYGETYGFDVRQARLYFVYGPGKNPETMHLLYQAMFGPLAGMKNVHSPIGGDQELDWTHVEDTADGAVRLLTADSMRSEIVNISCGVAYQHRDIIDRVTALLGHDSGMTLGPGPFTPRGAPLNIGKAREKLGFKPRFANIDEGLADYRRWLAASRSRRDAASRGARAAAR